MEKNHVRLGIQHVMVDRHDVQAVRAQSLQHGVDFALTHGDVASDLSIVDMTGLTSCCKSTRSPIITSLPSSPFVNATQPPKPKGVGVATPEMTTCKSLRGTFTFRTFAL